ncbi:MAG: hypothetical protein C0609_07490 [Deltaproteobacteria bacterium]|nr:MAG: hypothetical protein C0609_07490 [Deltaproteobacteria bacterium]
MDSALRILPVFIVIGAGFVGRRLGFLPDSFRGPANRLVYYFAIPCLIFLKVVKAPFSEILRPSWIVLTLAAILLIWAAALLISRLMGLSKATRATFVHSSIHSNIGYIGLAAAFYGLGERGVQAASIFAPFYMLMNNALAVGTLRHFGGGEHSARGLLKALVIHPIILTSFAAMAYEFSGLPLPTMVEDSMSIMAGMSLPLALLLIGAGLDTEALGHAKVAAVSTFLKTLALPALGSLLLTLAGAGGIERAAAVLLLCAPTATVTLILANEMGGDASLASTSVTLSTLISIGTLTLWLGILG